MHTLWDISATPGFLGKHPVNSFTIKTLNDWLTAPATEWQVHQCACIVLFGALSPERASVEYIKARNEDKVLIRINALVRNSPRNEVVREALQLLETLARPQVNKSILIREATTLDSMFSRLQCDPSPVIQHGIVKVIRQLLKGSISNVQYFLGVSESQSQETTRFRDILRLYNTIRFPPFRVDLAHIVVEIWRTLNPKTQEAPDRQTIDVLLHSAKEAECNIATPVAYLITDSDNATLTTQGWLGLSLISKTLDGCDAVYDVLCTGGNASKYRDMIAAQDPTSHDRINTRILHQHLKQSFVSLMPLATDILADFDILGC